MNDFNEGQDNVNNEPDNNNPPPTKKPNTLLDLLMGTAIAAIAYLIIWLVLVGNNPTIVMVLVDFIVLAAYGFLNVKFFRTGHRAAAVIMLILISPCILVLLLLGACTLTFSPH